MLWVITFSTNSSVQYRFTGPILLQKAAEKKDKISKIKAKEEGINHKAKWLIPSFNKAFSFTYFTYLYSSQPQGQ